MSDMSHERCSSNIYRRTNLDRMKLSNTFPTKQNKPKIAYNFPFLAPNSKQCKSRPNFKPITFHEKKQKRVLDLTTSKTQTGIAKHMPSRREMQPRNDNFVEMHEEGTNDRIKGRNLSGDIRTYVPKLTKSSSSTIKLASSKAKIHPATGNERFKTHGGNDKHAVPEMSRMTNISLNNMVIPEKSTSSATTGKKTICFVSGEGGKESLLDTITKYTSSTSSTFSKKKKRHASISENMSSIYKAQETKGSRAALSMIRNCMGDETISQYIAAMAKKQKIKVRNLLARFIEDYARRHNRKGKVIEPTFSVRMELRDFCEEWEDKISFDEADDADVMLEEVLHDYNTKYRFWWKSNVPRYSIGGSTKSSVSEEVLPSFDDPQKPPSSIYALEPVESSSDENLESELKELEEDVALRKRMISRKSNAPMAGKSISRKSMISRKSYYEVPTYKDIELSNASFMKTFWGKTDECNWGVTKREVDMYLEEQRHFLKKIGLFDDKGFKYRYSTNPFRY